MDEEIIELILLGLTSIGLILGLALLGTAIGAFVGWVVKQTFLGSAVIKVWFSLTHVKCELWELGAFLGFLLGFIKGTVQIKNEK